MYVEVYLRVSVYTCINVRTCTCVNVSHTVCVYVSVEVSLCISVCVCGRVAPFHLEEPLLDRYR